MKLDIEKFSKLITLRVDFFAKSRLDPDSPRFMIDRGIHFEQQYYYNKGLAEGMEIAMELAEQEDKESLDKSE